MDLDFRNISSPGLLKLKTIREMASLATRFIIGGDFAVTRSSPKSCWDCFAIVSEQTAELKWLILNKHNRWFHSSRVKLPLVRMSASWFLVSMYLIWILGSRLIRSINQSRATLWVLKHFSLWDSSLQWSSCSLLHCLRTHTTKLLGARTGRLREHYQYSWARWSSHEIFDFFQYQQVAPFCLKSESRFQKQKQLDPITPEQATRLISIQYPKRWSQILLNCEKQQFVSCTSILLEQMYDFQKTHNVSPEVDFESSRSPAKSESWNSPSLHCFAILPTWQYCLYSHVWWIYEINRFRRLSQALVHFVIDRANLFTWP